MIKKEACIILLMLLIIPLISAGLFSDIWGKITGKISDSQNVDLNISVTSGTAPWIYNITGLEAVTLTDGPNPTYLTINFSVNDSDGVGNLDNSTAMLNLTSGANFRMNDSCAFVNGAGNFANYTCNITMWWWDATGAWTVYVNISDSNGNTHINGTHTRTLNTLTGFVMDQSSLTFTSLLAGAKNQTPSNYLTLNNTGNVDITSDNVQVNATDLFGETTPGQALWAGNFSVSTLTGGNIECNASTTDATAMVNMTYTGVVNSVLSAGNYTKEDGTAEEKLYTCLREVGSELSQQQYSTDQLGSWTVKVVV